MELADLEAAGSGDDRRLAATLGSASASLARFGVVVVYDAFAPSMIGELVANATAHAEKISAAVDAGVSPRSLR